MAGPGNSTPSTLRHMKSQVFGSAFPTPPRRTRTDPCAASGMKLSSNTELIDPSRAASTPPERLRKTFEHDIASCLENCPAINQETNWLRNTLNKKRSQYYDEAFAHREANNTIRSRAEKDSLVILEIKLSCNLQSERQFLIDVTFLISEIYQKPTGCIMVLINENVSVLLDGSSEPAYQISISASIYEIAVTKNKRTAGLIHLFMLENTNIAASRGVLLFHSIPEGSLVTELSYHSNTGKAEHDDNDTDGLLSVINKPKGRRSRKSSVVKPSVTRGLASTIRTATPSFFASENRIHIESDTGKGVPQKNKLRKRRSLMALLGF